MSKLFNRLNIVLVLALLLATLFGFAQIPEGDKLPAHWNINGAIIDVVGDAEFQPRIRANQRVDRQWPRRPSTHG